MKKFVFKNLYAGPDSIGRLLVVGKKVRFYPIEGLGLRDAAYACFVLINQQKLPVVMKFNSVKIKVPYDEKITTQQIMNLYFDLSR